MSDADSRCPRCDKPIAERDDYDRFKGGEGAHLCWDGHACTPVDWRARAMAAEKTAGLALRFVRAFQAEGQAKLAWAAGAHDELVEGSEEDYQGPLTEAYDNAMDARIVAFKLLAKAVT